MNNMTVFEIVEKVLSESDRPLSSREIWEIALKNGYDKKLRSIGKTPINTISTKIYNNVNGKSKAIIFIKTDKGRFWIKSKVKNEKQLAEVDAKAEQEEDKKTGLNMIKEEDLHELLRQYLSSKKIYQKTINANTIKSKIGEMKWGTPDVLGVLFKDNLNETILNFADKVNIPTTEIYAYELKLKLEMSSFRKEFLQVLSNSSWANEAWLVVLSIEKTEDFRTEMQLFNQAFGVGILRLDNNDIEKSEVIFPAKKREILDLDTMSKLCSNNKFKDFIEDVTRIIKADSKDKQAIINELIEKDRFDKDKDTND